MLSFEQVATKTQITAEQYLRMTFEHDAEFVHGEIVERSMPDYYIRSYSSYSLAIGRLTNLSPVPLCRAADEARARCLSHS